MASIPLLRRPLRRRKLRPATLKRRLAATLINLLATLAALALTLGASVLAYRRFRKRRREPERPLHAVPDDRGAEPTRTRQWPDGQRFADALQARPVKLGLRMLAFVLTLRRAGSRSLGFRLLGLRLALDRAVRHGLDLQARRERVEHRRLARAGRSRQDDRADHRRSIRHRNLHNVLP
jgi:hypothetical protein